MRIELICLLWITLILIAAGCANRQGIPQDPALSGMRLSWEKNDDIVTYILNGKVMGTGKAALDRLSTSSSLQHEALRICSPVDNPEPPHPYSLIEVLMRATHPFEYYIGSERAMVHFVTWGSLGGDGSPTHYYFDGKDMGQGWDGISSMEALPVSGSILFVVVPAVHGPSSSTVDFPSRELHMLMRKWRDNGIRVEFLEEQLDPHKNAKGKTGRKRGQAPFFGVLCGCGDRPKPCSCTTTAFKNGACPHLSVIERISAPNGYDKNTINSIWEAETPALRAAIAAPINAHPNNAKWIPGDWGYIRNTDPDAPRPRAGQNVIYIGGSEQGTTGLFTEDLNTFMSHAYFWGHRDGQGKMTFQQFFNIVEGWSSAFPAIIWPARDAMIEIEQEH